MEAIAAGAALAAALRFRTRRRRERARPVVVFGWRCRDPGLPALLALRLAADPVDLGVRRFEQGGPPLFSTGEWDRAKDAYGGHPLPLLTVGERVVAGADDMLRFACARAGLEVGDLTELAAMRDRWLALAYGPHEPDLRRYRRRLKRALASLPSGPARPAAVTGADLLLLELAEQHARLGLPMPLERFPRLEARVQRARSAVGEAAEEELRLPVFNPAARSFAKEGVGSS